MPFLGKTAPRIVAAILVTALIPLVSALLVSRTIITRVSATAFQPEFGAHLDQALGVYADLAKATKQGMRAEAEAIAMTPSLRAAVAGKGPVAIDKELEYLMTTHPSLRSIRIETCGGTLIDLRETKVDAAAERTLEVRKVIGERELDAIGCTDADPDAPPVLVATLAAPRARLDELDEAQTFARAYHQIERVHREEYLDRTYFNVFAALLVVTLVLAVAVGVLVARPVTRRIARLAAATRPVAEGDLSVRVGLTGDDEVADLGRSFDRMLEELSESRARLEFLRRMGEWQQVARRLAHEIKNPLTPIQLAVEECHRRYDGGDAEYKRIVETMAEVVGEEIGSLRRLCGEFSSFARLPEPELAPDDLAAFLREQSARFAAGRGSEGDEGDMRLLSAVDLAFEIPAGEMPAALDREMLHRVLGNVIRNAAQALRDHAPEGGEKPKIRVSARASESRYTVFVDDNGPGIPPSVREALFDPYVTTKRDGTGLGLSIVKKILVDHGGTIDTQASPLGGARFRIVIPRTGSAEARAALDRALSRAAPPPSSQPFP
jgi:two-component system, NtrC family, nitrogen regulation sensor histidine kinase NtrY